MLKLPSIPQKLDVAKPSHFLAPHLTSLHNTPEACTDTPMISLLIFKDSKLDDTES